MKEEMTNGTDWVVKVSEAEYRARSIDEVKEWYSERRISDENYVFHPILQKWMYVKDLEELSWLRDERQDAMKPSMASTSVHNGPIRVRTAEDSFLTRSRGCGDIVVFGPIVGIVLFLVLISMLSRGC